MTAGTGKLTAQAFIEKLQRDEIGAPLTLTGMVKVAEEDYSQLLFALGTRCADWTSVPLDVIESVEVLDTVPCDEHTHPLVKLTFKEPESSEGALFAGLLRAAVKRRGGRRAVHHQTTVSTQPGGGRGKLRSACAGACPQYAEFDDGIFELYSCQDIGPGTYVCYYE